jgi:predicted permease
MKYTDLFVGHEDNWQAYLVEFVFLTLLLVLGSNVATMVFARTVTREHEIAMRFALGASRGQIVTQFFAEALVLALAATAVGLAAVALGMAWFARFFWDVTQGEIPFWLDDRLNVTTVLYALVLAGLVSLVAGVIPAIKATGAGARGRLRHSAGAGDSSLRFGGVWSAVVVVQVIFTVLILPPAIVSVAALGQADHTDAGFAAGEFLSARLELEIEHAPGDPSDGEDLFARFQATCEELRRRLLANPEISGVTFASRLPGMAHPEVWVDVDGDGNAPGATDELVTATSVDANFFESIGTALLAGRPFNSGDAESSAAVVIVNEYFVNEILQGRSALGRRLRYTTRYAQQAAAGQPRGLPRAAMREPGEWYEIVGVVKNIGMDTTRDAFASGKGPGVYHPLTQHAMGSGGAYAVRMAFHVRGDAGAFAPKLRELAHAVHPALRTYDVLPLDGPVDRVSRAQRRIGRFFSSLTAAVAFIAILISVAGTYSVMSFTVSRQTREIGIRIALGADGRRIVAGVFSRAMVQIGAGIVLGTVIWFYVIVHQLGGGKRIELLAASALLLMVLGVLACGIPVRRALRIEPTEALRNVG